MDRNQVPKKAWLGLESRSLLGEAGLDKLSILIGAEVVEDSMNGTTVKLQDPGVLGTEGITSWRGVAIMITLSRSPPQ